MITLQIAEDLSASQKLRLDKIITREGPALERAAREALLYTEAHLDAELTIVLTGDAHMQALNRQYLGIDAPTDVLSFPAGETDIDSGEPYLGDILISHSRASAQAATAGHSIREEVQILIVHGVLHLLGYDHADEVEKTKMGSAQAKILERIK